MLRFCVGLVALSIVVGLSQSQEKSVRPGINDPFQNPDVKKYENTFENESREVSAKRKDIVKAIGLKPGQTIADIGAGTGLFTRLFSQEVGEKGKVYAVDISEKFLEHIRVGNKAAGITNVTHVLCKPDSVELPENIADVVFICDTYHHFEFPHRTMSSIHKALKPEGRVVLIDFRREKGQSSDWLMNHVRAGQNVFEKEIQEAGFKKISEEKDLLKENYLVVFEKEKQAQSRLLFPIIKDYGGVTNVTDAMEPPQKGTKVVFDVTAASKNSGKPLPGLERAAVFLNLAGASGLTARDLEIVIVLHGDATMACLDDATHRAKTERPNENSELIDRLTKAGVRVLVCGQSLSRKGLDRKSVLPVVHVVASAVSAVINFQSRGHAYIPSH